MIKISLRYKVALELYASLSFFIAVLILIYTSIFNWFDDNIFIPSAIIGIFLIAFIFFLRTLIMDVNSIKFENDNSKEDPNFVEIKLINKITLELISSISNIIIVTAIFIIGTAKSGGAYPEFIMILFIIILFFPSLILLKSLIFDFNLIFMNKKHQENFLSEFVNRKTLVFFVIAVMIIFLLISSNKIVTSLGNLYQKPMSNSEKAIIDISSNLYITSISGERKNISAGPITGLSIFLEAMDLDFNFKSITVKFIDKKNKSTLEYGTNADESHFYYEGKKTGKGNTILKKGDVGIITINLSSTKQELYSYDGGTVQLILGNGRIIFRDFKAPEFKEDSRILLYSST